MMIFIGKNTIKTHTHTQLYFVYRIYILCHQLLLLYFCEYSAAFRLSPLLTAPHTFIASTKLRRHWRQATGHTKTYNGTNGSRNRIFTAFLVVCQSRSHTLSLLPLRTLAYALVSLPLSFSLLMITRATPRKYLTNTQRSFIHIKRLYTTGYIAYFREKHISQTTASPMGILG